jgi:hypothetical protein
LGTEKASSEVVEKLTQPAWFLFAKACEIWATFSHS